MEDERSVGTQRVVVIGLGYVGLPLVKQCVAAGWHVTGLDVNPQVVASLNGKRSHVDDISDADLSVMCDAGFVATTETKCLGDADVIVVCVPTPLSEVGGPDLTYLNEATNAVVTHACKGQTLILESTSYPGTTEELIVEPIVKRGFRVGEDIWIAFSPERIDPGNSTYGLLETPKVVGGATSRCAIKASDFYESIGISVVMAKGLREAEMTKLLENSFRQVNIALVNELASFCKDLEIDVWNTIECASTKPFGFKAFYPGPGVGGHCIPIDPNYLSHIVRRELGIPFRLIELAQEINQGMPLLVCNRIQDLLNSERMPMTGSRVLLLGVTYKADISDVRQSPSEDVLNILRRRGAVVSYHDPYVPVWELGFGTLHSEMNLRHAITNSDLVVLLQGHRAILDEPITNWATRIFDTRGLLEGPNVTRL